MYDVVVGDVGTCILRANLHRTATVYPVYDVIIHETPAPITIHFKLRNWSISNLSICNLLLLKWIFLYIYSFTDVAGDCRSYDIFFNIYLPRVDYVLATLT